MDPSDTPPKADVAEVDADIGFQVSFTPTLSPPAPAHHMLQRPPPTPLQAPLASSIFRDAREPAYRPGGEDVRQWQEEEMQRKLRGEYEAAQRRIGEVVTTSMDHPLHLASVRLSPSLRHTRSGFLASLIAPFISPSEAYPFSPRFIDPAANLATPPGTLHEVLLTTKHLVNHLRRFDIFADHIDIKLEPARGGAIGDVDLVLGLREKGRLFLKAGTEVGGGEGGANVTGRLRNLFGGAESLEINASFGTKTKHAYQATLATPLFASPLLNFAVSGFSLDRDNTIFASHRERSQGVRAKLSAIAPWGVHDLVYEYVDRDIGGLTPKASMSIRELAHPSTKASVAHTWTRDTRDDSIMGTRGSLLKVIHVSRAGGRTPRGKC